MRSNKVEYSSNQNKLISNDWYMFIRIIININNINIFSFFLVKEAPLHKSSLNKSIIILMNTKFTVTAYEKS